MRIISKVYGGGGRGGGIRAGLGGMMVELVSIQVRKPQVQILAYRVKRQIFGNLAKQSLTLYHMMKSKKKKKLCRVNKPQVLRKFKLHLSEFFFFFFFFLGGGELRIKWMSRG